MIPLPPWAYAIAAGATIATSFGAGWMVKGWKVGAEQAASLKDAIADYQRTAATINGIAASNEQDEAKANEASHDRQTEIRTIYRTIEVPVACVPDPGAISLLGQAIADANARAGGQPIATLSPAP